MKSEKLSDQWSKGNLTEVGSTIMKAPGPKKAGRREVVEDSLSLQIRLSDNEQSALPLLSKDRDVFRLEKWMWKELYPVRREE